MFNGFLPPTENWSKLPNELIDQLSVIDTLAEMKVILYVLRHTWGYQDEWKKITVDEFANGRKRKDGSRLDNGTGMSEPAIRNGIDKAIEHGFLFVEIDSQDKGRIKKYYCLNSQGVKDLPPDLKEFTPRHKESLPRTEKETYSKKPQDIGKSTDLPTDKKPEVEKPVTEKPKTELFNYFTDYTKIPKPTNGEAKWWWSRIGIIYTLAGEDVPTGKRLIKQAVDKLREDDLTISDPGSLVKTIRAMVGNVATTKIRISAV